MTMPRSLITRAVYDERRQQFEQSLLQQAGGGSGSDAQASKRNASASSTGCARHCGTRSPPTACTTQQT